LTKTIFPEALVKTEDIITHLFCPIDDRMKFVPKHPQAELYPSEIVTIGALFTLKGGRFRHFHRWLQREFSHLFPRLPERTRLQRLLATHRDWTDRFLRAPTFFTVTDSYGIELIHPMREGRSEQQIGKKGKSNRRWIVGVKMCWIVNQDGRVVDWQWTTANECDNCFLPLIQQYEGRTITLSDLGFRCKDGVPENLKLCQQRTWNERGLIETIFSFLTNVCSLKKLFHRTEWHLEMHLSYLVVLFNVLLEIAAAPQGKHILPVLKDFAL
jgi:hypothetical protein